MENLSALEKKRRAPQPPGYPMGSSKTEGYNVDNRGQVLNSKDSQRLSVPPPDYETIYAKKRHGVVAQTRWDHVIAQVNQRNWDLSEEMNVDGPEQPITYKSSILRDRTSESLNQHQKNQEALHPTNVMHREPLIPPNTASSVSPKPMVEGNIQYSRIREPLSATVNTPSPTVQSRNAPQEAERKAQAKERPTPAARTQKADRDSISEDAAKETPAVKPRQRSVMRDQVGQAQPDKQVSTQPVTLERNQAETSHNGTIIPVRAEDKGSKKTTDPFTKISEKSTAATKSENKKQSPSFTEQARETFQRNFSFRKKNASRQYPTTKASTEKTNLDRSISQCSQDAEDDELTVTSVGPPDRTESTVVTSDPQLGGKSSPRAWVSPSEAQPVTLQNGSGSAVSNSRRPHPVKPLSSTDSAVTVGKDQKTLTIREMAEKSKNTDGGPYTQLTQDELITLVVKQQDELSKKDVRIQELENYIDNLLVRVMEEKPAILLSLHSKC